MVNKLPKERVIEIIKDAVEIEKEFVVLLIRRKVSQRLYLLAVMLEFSDQIFYVIVLLGVAWGLDRRKIYFRV